MAGTDGETPLAREVEERFVACWAGLAGAWGVPPAHARIHGLLYLARRPLDEGTIRERLRISHGSCVQGLNDLVAWGVARRVKVPGLRRAKFAVDPDGWKWLHGCVRERRRRELEPLLRASREAAEFAADAVRRARAERRPGVLELVETRDRVRGFARFLEELASIADAFLALGGARPKRLVRRLRGEAGGDEAKRR
jgi:DNA-binding transcriptional regulator GbsR (MarR family)